jgi:hypothetical protein
MAKNGNQAKVGGLGGDLGKSLRINLIIFFPGRVAFRYTSLARLMGLGPGPGHLSLGSTQSARQWNRSGYRLRVWAHGRAERLVGSIGLVEWRMYFLSFPISAAGSCCDWSWSVLGVGGRDCRCKLGPSQQTFLCIYLYMHVYTSVYPHGDIYSVWLSFPCASWVGRRYPDKKINIVIHMCRAIWRVCPSL